MLRIALLLPPQPVVDDETEYLRLTGGETRQKTLLL
jgi:hypothetical protein